ncbi:MAG: IPT/TIG domain-containing protein [Acidobacteria bacterium]|nr:IPT/TIG domain-containing protein [Acidobacteriota bacterium]
MCRAKWCRGGPCNAFQRVCLSAILAVVLAASSGLYLQAQVSVLALPPAGLIESSRLLTLTAQVSGVPAGGSTAVSWSLNDQLLANTANVLFTLGDAPPGVPVLLKAASVFDPSIFTAVPIIPLQRSELVQVALPQAVAYHPSTGRIYVASLAVAGSDFNTNIVAISPEGGSTVVATIGDLIHKLLPYRSSTGTPYLLGVGFVDGSVYALNLDSRNSRQVVAGLTQPITAAFHPGSGDLYIGEEIQGGRISVVSRADLDSAINGASQAPFLALPVAIELLSGVGFLVDRDSRDVSLLASTFNGALFRVNLEDNTAVQVASGLFLAQEVLVMESAALGFSFVITASPILGGEGRISVVLPLGDNQPFSPPYTMAAGLDVPTDVAFAPEGNSYSATGRPVIIAASSSPEPNPGRIFLWEIDPLVQGDFAVYNDRVQPQLNLVAPAAGELLLPGSPVEVRWTYAQGNPLNPPNAPPPAPTEIMLSTDGGNSFAPAGPSYLPSVSQSNEYSQIWQVPAGMAGATIKLRVETQGLDGQTSTAASEGDFTIVPMPVGIPMALRVRPNFVVAGEDAEVTIDGLNFQADTSAGLGEGVVVNSVDALSSSRLQIQITGDALAAEGLRNVLVCNSGDICRETESAFFVLPPDAPRITAIAPAGGPPGTTVTITGSNFSGVAASNQISFGSLAATISQASPGQLVVQVPFGLSKGKLPLAVETNGISGNAADFFLIPQGFSFPAANQDGAVNGASFVSGGAPLAAGSIVSLFGSRLFPAIASASVSPLPREFLNTSVLAGGVMAPLFFVAPNQVNVQLPEEVAGLGSVALTVVSRGISGNTIVFPLSPQSPGIFSVDSSGTGPGAVLNQDGSLNGPDNPERISNVLQVFSTGLGSSDPPVGTGLAAPRDPLSESVTPPSATIDGLPATVSFSGRSPDFVGLDQVNLVIPEGVTTGEPVPLVLTGGENASNTVTVHVRDEMDMVDPGPEPIQLSGFGQQVTQNFTLESGLSIFRMTHNGTSNFMVTLFDSNGQSVETLVNEMGAFGGAKAVEISEEGEYFLDISADGMWMVEIEQPRPLSAEGPPRTFTGMGQQVSPFVNLDAGVFIFRMSHNGTSNFIVALLDSNGQRVETLVNEIGVFNGSKMVGIDSPGLFLLDILADGDWTISVE